MKTSLLAPSTFRHLLASCIGMLAGAAIDASQGGFVLLAGLCAGSTTMGLADLVRLHWLCLPFMHAGMVAGGMIGAALTPRQIVSGLAGTALMLVGMTMGSYVWLKTGLVVSEIADASLMLIAMFAGMTVAMSAFRTRRNR